MPVHRRKGVWGTPLGAPPGCAPWVHLWVALGVARACPWAHARARGRGAQLGAYACPWARRTRVGARACPRARRVRAWASGRVVARPLLAPLGCSPGCPFSTVAPADHTLCPQVVCTWVQSWCSLVCGWVVVSQCVFWRCLDTNGMVAAGGLRNCSICQYTANHTLWPSQLPSLGLGHVLSKCLKGLAHN